MPSIRITSVPPGEAPREIREAWVGLVLPLHRARAGTYFTSGVLSRPRGVLRILRHLFALRYNLQRGYVVSSLAAMAVLETANPAAARWWRDSAGYGEEARRYFLFAGDCCEQID
jgi:hypothetical protein